MCLYPSLIKNRRFEANKKNGGNIPPVHDVRTLYVPVGCGKCMECRKKKARDWQVRMMEEIRTAKNGVMVTLTFSDESIRKLSEGEEAHKGYNLDNRIATKAVRLFLERWRKKYKKSARHWLVTELGHNGTENIHLHGILWAAEQREQISKIWQYGYTWIGDYVNEATVNYSIKYVTKIDIKHQLYKPIVLTSAGIGGEYAKANRAKENEYMPGKTNEAYRTRTGHKIALPIYYRNKIYTDEQKERLWIEKIEKEERWVGGVKINTARNKELYWEALKTQREKNTKLGYGNNDKDWVREKYEEAMREIMQETRKQRAIKNAFGGR